VLPLALENQPLNFERKSQAAGSLFFSALCNPDRIMSKSLKIPYLFFDTVYFTTAVAKTIIGAITAAIASHCLPIKAKMKASIAKIIT